MTNIGIALYKKSDEPGNLDAEWRHSEHGFGVFTVTKTVAQLFTLMLMNSVPEEQVLP